MLKKGHVVITQRRPRRGLVTRNTFDPATDEARPSTSVQLSLAAVNLALRKHVPDQEKCDTIAKDVFTSAVRLQREGKADEHIEKSDPISIARLTRRVACASVTTSASPVVIRQSSITTKPKPDSGTTSMRT